MNMTKEIKDLMEEAEFQIQLEEAVAIAKEEIENWWIDGMIAKAKDEIAEEKRVEKLRVEKLRLAQKEEYRIELEREEEERVAKEVAKNWIIKKGPVTLPGDYGLCTGVITGVTEKNIMWIDGNGKKNRKNIETFRYQYAGINN